MGPARRSASSVARGHAGPWKGPATEDKETLRRYYSGAVQRCLDIWSQLDEEDWAERDPKGPWTARDYLAHVATAQEKIGNVVTAQAVAGQPANVPGFRGRADIDEFNQRNVEALRNLSRQEVLSRVEAAYQAHFQMLEPLSEDDLQKPASTPGLGRPGTLEDIYNIRYIHLPLHYQDIRRCLRRRTRLTHWANLITPEETLDGLRRSFAALALYYWPERGDSLRVTYLFNVRGKGGGQWTLEIAEGRATSRPGRPERPDVEIQIGPGELLDLQTKDLNTALAFVTRRVRIKPLAKVRLAMRLKHLFEIT